MKRVQAIVTGKKKQCTKLPKPSAKDKRSSNTPETLSPSSPRGSDTGKRTKGSGLDKHEASVAGDASSLSSTVVTGSSTNSTSSKGAAKIPTGTSTKKGSKNGDGGKSSRRGRLTGAFGGTSKSESSKKTSSNAKKSAGQVSKNVDQSDGNGSTLVQIPSVSEDPEYVKQNRYAEECQETDVNAQVPVEDESSPPPADGGAVSDETKVTDDRASHTSGSEAGSAMNPSNQGNRSVASTQQAPPESDNRARDSQQGHSRQHPNGILKDSSRSGPTLNTNNNGHTSSDHQYNGVTTHQRMQPLVQTSQPSSRARSTKEAADLYYQQTYGSLPRASRSATPTAENAYNYGSFPRRSHVGTAPQPNMLYSSTHGWGSLSRKAESDSGFSGSNLDRSHSNGSYAVPNHNRYIHDTTSYSNKEYATIGHGYRDPRSSSAHLSGRNFHEYPMSRSGSGPINYYSDTETLGYRHESGGYPRTARGGSVPRGYASESGTYGVVGPGRSRFGSVPRNNKSSDFDPGSSSGLRVESEDEQYRAGQGKRPFSRRHTLGASNNRAHVKNSETERKREAFMQLLAQRYPQYADRIQGGGPLPSALPQQQERPSRSRDVQRRRTAAGIYHPIQAGSNLEYEDLGTMSDLEISTFQRGGFMRTSMPIVRSASTSLERPLGLVFLVYGDQTKKSLLPNEITTLDTVRALFVRAFPDLTMEMLENPRRKIYLFDPAVNMFFQLEDLAEIKDRSVLKLHETNSDQPQKVKERQEIRGRTVQTPVTRSHSRSGYGENPTGNNEVFIKSQSLPPQAIHNHQDVVHDQWSQWELGRRSRSRTPEPAERQARSRSAGTSSHQRFSHSPDRMPTPDRLLLNTIPENRQMLGYRAQGSYQDPASLGVYRGQYPSGIYDSPNPYQGYPATPNQQMYVSRSTRVPPMAHTQRAITPGLDMRDSTLGRHPHAFAAATVAQGATPDTGFQRSQSYRIPPTERDGKELSRSHSVTQADDTARNRIEKMEQQLANLTAWVHYQKDGPRQETVSAPRSLSSATSDSSDTFPASSASSLSDICDENSNKRTSGLNSRESTPLSAQAEVTAQLAQLKSDLHVLRRQQQLHMEVMKEELVATFSKIKTVLSSLPGQDNQGNLRKRNETAVIKGIYISDKQEVDKTLSDLEANIEALRKDVISKQFQVNKGDVDDMTLHLGNITKSLANLKIRFSDIHGQMKHVLDDEMKILASEERFLKDQAREIENSQKRCRQVSESLVNLKRLITAEGQASSHVSHAASPGGVSAEQKTSPASAQTVVPHFQQVAMETKVADVSGKEKTKISLQQETLKSSVNLVASDGQARHQSEVCRSEEQEADKRSERDSKGEPKQEKPVAAPRPPENVRLSSVVTPISTSAVKIHSVTNMPKATSLHLSTASAARVTTLATVHRSSTATSSSFVPATSAASSTVSVKPSFSVASAISKPSEKPTATVSAMTAPVSDTVNTTALKTADKESDFPIMKNVVIPLTQTTGRLTNTALAKSESETTSPKARSESFKKKNATVYTYQVCGPVNPVFPIPPVFNETENTDGTSSNKTSPTEIKDKNTNVLLDKSELESSETHINKPPNLSLSKTDSVKKGPVSFSDPPVTNPKSRDLVSPPNSISNHPGEKMGLATQKQAARSAFFSSLNTPPDSPSSPNRNSASLDSGPVISPSGPTAKSTQGSTINLILTGSASPKSPTSPGSFTIAPPSDLSSRAVEGKTSSTAPVTDCSSQSHDSQSLYSGSKQKKVPPPPPPRNGSRPTSASISPVNGGPPDTSSQQSNDMPRFVGGIMGQHRLSGGPLFSTPKPILQQDSANGIYVNLNQQDAQNQKNSTQQVANTLTNVGNARLVTPQPPKTSNLDEQDSGSDSTKSSSGTTSSQQSVHSVVRSSSVSVKDSSKAKPDPPKRHSSLLSKLTGSKDKNKLNNGKAKVNGVDL